MAVEGFINELGECAAFTIQDHEEPPAIAAVATVLATTEDSRGSTEAKYMLAHLALTGNAYDRGGPPYQEFALLLEARNALVHHKPERWVSRGDGSEALYRQAASVRKKLEERHLTCEAAAFYPFSHLTDLIRTRAVARWAINTAWSMMQSIITAVPESECRKVLMRVKPPVSPHSQKKRGGREGTHR
jgi:hypothetical protein